MGLDTSCYGTPSRCGSTARSAIVFAYETTDVTNEFGTARKPERATLQARRLSSRSPWWRMERFTSEHVPSWTFTGCCRKMLPHPGEKLATFFCLPGPSTLAGAVAGGFRGLPAHSRPPATPFCRCWRRHASGRYCRNSPCLRLGYSASGALSGLLRRGCCRRPGALLRFNQNVNRLVALRYPYTLLSL